MLAGRCAHSGSSRDLARLARVHGSTSSLPPPSLRVSSAVVFGSSVQRLLCLLSWHRKEGISAARIALPSGRAEGCGAYPLCSGEARLCPNLICSSPPPPPSLSPPPPCRQHRSCHMAMPACVNPGPPSLLLSSRLLLPVLLSPAPRAATPPPPRPHAAQSSRSTRSLTTATQSDRYAHSSAALPQQPALAALSH